MKANKAKDIHGHWKYDVQSEHGADMDDKFEVELTKALREKHYFFTTSAHQPRYKIVPESLRLMLWDEEQKDFRGLRNETELDQAVWEIATHVVTAVAYVASIR